MLDRFSLDWKELKHIVLYGYGTVGKSCLEKINKDFVIDYILDRNYEEIGRKLEGFNVVSPEKGLAILNGRKIVVMTGGRVYIEITKFLEMNGLKEYYDFCSIEYFITVWYWVNRNENCILELHSALTMNCTLKCKNCNMFVPYYKDSISYELSQIKEEIDLLFKYVDFCFCYTLLGGEPFLYKQIGNVISFIGEYYGSKIGKIKVITNGTIIPDDYVIQVLKQYGVWVSISDYTCVVPYEIKLNQLCSILNSNGIDYSISKQEKWLAFGFPDNPFNFDKAICAQHMLECSPIFHGYNDRRVYYCHVSWSAEKTGQYVLKKKDYVSLDELNIGDRHMIAEHCAGYIEDGFVSFCRLCGGCGKDNTCGVEPGEQMETMYD